MNIIIIGLPGTGKTTLSKNLEHNLGFTYINDYTILKESGISFENSLDIIDLDYFDIINNYMTKENCDNFVFDFNYCITPNKAIKLYNGDSNLLYYLGFSGVDFEILKSKMKNDELTEEETDKKISLFLEKSEKYRKLCEEYNVNYISINKEKSIILEKLQNQISATINM